MDTTTLETLREKTKSVRIAMLTTMRGEDHHARPMATREMGEDGTLWFLTAEGTNKVKEIEKNPRIGLVYADPGSECYVSFSGTAKVTNDRAHIEKFWNPFYRAWFEGPEDPSIRLIEITPSSAEYWDTKGGKIVSLIYMAASAITGKNLEKNSENEEVDLSRQG